MRAYKVQYLCGLVFHVAILVRFLFVINIVCQMCKSFDRKKKDIALTIFSVLHYNIIQYNRKV